MSLIESFYVYELWDPFLNTPFYVGKGKYGSNNPRHKAHLRDALKTEKDHYKNNAHKDHKIRKIIRLGKKPLIKIVFKCFNEQEAFNKEIELIKKYGRRDLKKGPLTNHTDGGEGRSGHIFTKEERLKRSLSHRGPKNYMYGRKHSQATIHIIRTKKLARKEIYHHTESWKEELKKSPLILRTKEKALPIYQIDFTGKITKKWSSANAAATEFKIGNGQLYVCAKHNHRICKGFYWIYVKDAKIENSRLKNIDELNKRRLQPHTASPINQYTTTGEFIKTWLSYSSVQRELNLDYSILSNIIRGKRKSNVYGGFLWKSIKEK